MFSAFLNRNNITSDLLSDKYVIGKYNAISTNDVFVLMLASVSFFIHPFFVLISASLLQVYVRIKPTFFLPVFCISLALYWSLRKIGVEWEGGFDDAVGYIESFQAMKDDTIATLIQKYFGFPAGNELGYNILVYFVRLVTSNERIFLFVIYFSMLALISIGSVRVSNRYYLIIISLIFFGIGGFVEQAALHLFRATLASLVLLVAISIYEQWKKLAWCLLVTACLIHTAVVPLIVFFILINNLKFLSRNIALIIFSLLVVLSLKYTTSSSDSFLREASRASYINADTGGVSSEVVTLSMIISMFLILSRYSNERIYKFSFFVTCLLFFLYLFLPEYTFIAGRYLYIIQLFAALLFFKVVMKIKFKWLICSVLILLFVKKMTVLNNSDFIKGVFDNFSSIFSAPFFILVN